MEVRIKFITHQGIEMLKNSFREDIDKYIKGDKKYFLDKLEEGGFLQDTPYVVDDFTPELKNPSDENYMDVENSAILHKALKDIPEYIMTDERIWTGLCYTHMWDYVIKRRDILKSSTEDYNDIFDSFFLTLGKNSIKRSLYVHCVARLWWTGHLVYDEQAKDPYHLLKQLDFNGNAFAGTVVPFSSSNIASRKETCLGVLGAVERVRNEGVKVPRDTILRANKYLNIYCGVSIIDILTRQEVADLLYNNYFKPLMVE